MSSHQTQQQPQQQQPLNHRTSFSVSTSPANNSNTPTVIPTLEFASQLASPLIDHSLFSTGTPFGSSIGPTGISDLSGISGGSSSGNATNIHLGGSGSHQISGTDSPVARQSTPLSALSAGPGWPTASLGGLGGPISQQIERLRKASFGNTSPRQQQQKLPQTPSSSSSSSYNPFALLNQAYDQSYPSQACKYNP